MRKSHNDRDLHASVSFAPDGQNLEGVEEALKGQAVEGAAYPIVGAHAVPNGRDKEEGPKDEDPFEGRGGSAEVLGGGGPIRRLIRMRRGDGAVGEVVLTVLAEDAVQAEDAVLNKDPAAVLVVMFVLALAFALTMTIGQALKEAIVDDIASY
ncbi:hypothetical protein MMC12_004994 [Toensbergia leucococca]|nr:hypothetical protein [Toensbergia leucococca]